MKRLSLILLLVCATALPARADYMAGLVAFDDGNYEQALKEWRPLALQGDDRAQLKLGLMYIDGLGVTKDNQIAAQYFNKAVVRGNPEAIRYLSIMYELGVGVDRDIPN